MTQEEMQKILQEMQPALDRLREINAHRFGTSQE
jgi:hypothetical protein